MTLTDISFLLIGAITIGGAYLAVGLKNVFYNALGLGLSFFGVAGIFIFLNAEFIAVMQVIIYIGAIAVAIIFAIMMSQPLWIPQPDSRPRMIRSGIFALVFFGIVSYVLLEAPWPLSPDHAMGYPLNALGKDLLTRTILPFELISLVLLIAILGALLISRETGPATERWRAEPAKKANPATDRDA